MTAFLSLYRGETSGNGEEARATSTFLISIADNSICMNVPFCKFPETTAFTNAHTCTLQEGICLLLIEQSLSPNFISRVSVACVYQIMPLGGINLMLQANEQKVENKANTDFILFFKKPQNAIKKRKIL